MAYLMETASTTLESLTGAYNKRIQIQLDSVVREFDGLSRSILDTVRVHHEAAFHDFVCRKNTGAVPADPTNFHACLAGSIVMCDRAQVSNAGARQIEAELVSSSEISERPSSAWIRADHISIKYSRFYELFMAIPLRTWSQGIRLWL